MVQVVSTVGATVLSHDGTVHEADENGIFDIPAEVHASVGKALGLVDAAVHAAEVRAAALAEATKPEALHERLTAVEDTLAGIEAHVAGLVEDAVAKIHAAAAKVTGKAKKTAEAPPATETPAE